MKTNFLKVAMLALCVAPLSVLANSTHWGYEGNGAPEHWGNLDEAFKTCQSGTSQSPVNISSQSVHNQQLAELDVQYADGPSTLLNNGHTLQAEMSSYTPDSIQVGSDVYTLKQFHFHAPSENTIDGKHYALEMHLVHQDRAGKIAVVAVMFDIGEPNDALESLWQSIPSTGGNTPLFLPVNINELLPADKNYWRYNGSLTTPPCSEHVSWFVMKSPLTLSQEQLSKFKEAIPHNNNRPVQPLNGREVVE
ncbi:TPA: carbonic anhydrase family protein [Salmonella enterica subsp. salamae]|nr:carbonic anhydrase family protein [Salmonella enterica subsp. salamae]HCL5071228.1 carbonic anhydrase family protein [Salmonella enterica]